MKKNMFHNGLMTAGTVVALLVTPAVAQDMPTAAGAFINAKGEHIGTVELTETPNGVLLKVDVEGLPEGEHGLHIHETGECEPGDGFQSAGGHFAPRGNEHGFMTEGGPHAGDMANQSVSRDGVLKTDVLNGRVSLGDGEASLFDDDGSAVMVHAGADDYRSQPSGDAGDRIACAVIKKS